GRPDETREEEAGVADRVADAGPRSGVGGDPWLCLVRAGILRFAAPLEHGAVEGGALLVGPVESGSALGRPALRERIALVAEVHPRGLRQPFDRLDVGEMLQLPQERDGVPALPAPEAVEDLLGRRHAERWGLLLVERAQPAQGIVPALLQGEVVPDELDDVRPLLDRIDIVLPDPRHAAPNRVTGANPGGGRAARTSEERTGPSCRRCGQPRGWSGLPGLADARREARPDVPGSTGTDPEAA